MKLTICIHTYCSLLLLLVSARQLLRREARGDGARRGARERAVRSLDERAGAARVRAGIQRERRYEQHVLVPVGCEFDRSHRRLDHLAAERLHRCVCSLCAVCGGQQTAARGATQIAAYTSVCICTVYYAYTCVVSPTIGIETYCEAEPNASVSNSRLLDASIKRSLKNTAKVGCAPGFEAASGAPTATSTCEADSAAHGKWSAVQLQCTGTLFALSFNVSKFSVASSHFPELPRLVYTHS